MLKYKTIHTKARIDMVDITATIQDAIAEARVRSGICVVFVPHTTAGVTLNEHTDQTVKRDMIATLSQLIPQNAAYTHAEGNADAHIKTALVGSSVTIIFNQGELLLGAWQRILFCEFDGPRRRDVWIKFVSDMQQE